MHKWHCEALNDELTLRSIQPSDIPEVIQLHRMIYPLHYGAKFYQSLTSTSSLSFVVLHGRKIIGFCCCQRPDSEQMYLQTIGVIPVYRGLGIGSYVLGYLLDEARNTGVNSVTLHVHAGNTRGVHFYEKHHFVLLDRNHDYYKRLNPTTALLMGLNLAQCHTIPSTD